MRFTRRKLAIIVAAVAVGAAALPFVASALLGSRIVAAYVERKLSEKTAALPGSFFFGVKNVSLQGTISLDLMRVEIGGGEALVLRDCKAYGVAQRLLFGRRDFSAQCETGFADVGRIRDARKDAHLPSSGGAADGRFSLHVREMQLKLGGLSRTFSLSAEAASGRISAEIENPALGKLTFSNIKPREATFLLRLAGFKLRPALAAFFPGVAARTSPPDPPARFDGVNPSALAFRPALSEHVGGEVSGEVEVALEMGGVRARATRLTVKALEFNHPVLSDAPFALPELSVLGETSYSTADKTVRLRGMELRTGGAGVLLNASLGGGAYSVEARAADLTPNAVAAIVGGEELKDFDVDGRIDLSVKMEGDLRAGQKVSSAVVDGAVRNLKQRSARLNYLKGAFAYTFHNGRGEPVRVAVGEGNPDYVAFSAIPRQVYGAVVVSEDAGFFGHKGIEFKEIQSAIEDNLINGKPYLRGGSTITQQVAKNLFLTREKNVVRKVKEALLAMEIEATVSKERILEIYLNGIEWGPGLFGISAAARMYFGKGVEKIEPHEAAYLATIIPNPGRYYSYFIKNELKDEWYARIDDLISRMNHFGYLSADDFFNYSQKRIVFDRYRPDLPPVPEPAPE